MRGRASWSTCSLSAPTSWCATRAAPTRVTPSSSAVTCMCCTRSPRASSIPVPPASSATAWCSTPSSCSSNWTTSRSAARSRAGGCWCPTVRTWCCPCTSSWTSPASGSRTSAPRGAASGPATRTRWAVAASEWANLRNLEKTAELLAARVDRANHQLHEMGCTERASLDEHVALMERLAPRLLSHATDTGLIVDRAVRQGKSVLLEGAQGALLDVDHGTYPVRHVVQHHRWRCGGRRRHRPDGDSRRAGRGEGVHHARRAMVRFPRRRSRRRRSSCARWAASSAPPPGVPVAAAGSTRAWCSTRHG